MRIAIMGNSGSGKSTLARQFVARDGLAALDLDTVAWEPGKVAIARSRADAVGDNSWRGRLSFACRLARAGSGLLGADVLVRAALKGLRNYP